MGTHNADLFSLRGRCMQFRPNASASQVDAWLNDRVRQALDARTYWSDLITPKVLSVPDAYTTGTISVTPGSQAVSGVATAWPINDLVNTTIPDGVYDVGYVKITPASMEGITEDSMLYVDAAGDPEAVPVVELDEYSFIGKFSRTHNAGCTVTQSSLAGLQFRIAVTDPVFTVRNVISSTSLEMTDTWGGAAQSDKAYRLIRMYLTISSKFKDLLVMKDEQTGWPVRLHVPVTEVNHRDSRRTFTQAGALIQLVDLGPNEQGNMQYELWPASSTRRQFSCLFYKQWPDLIKDTDRFPPFINPTIFLHGAISDALNYKSSKDDPYHNPVLAQQYEKRFLMGLEQAKNADASKYQKEYQYRYSRMFMPAGADFAQGHPDAVMSWDFGGGY